MLDLLAHGQDEEDHPVHDEDGPKDRDVEDLEPCAEKGYGDGASGPVPELELGQSTDKGSELLVALGREGAHAVLHVRFEVIVGGVELGLEEGEEEVEQVDAERVGNDVPSLRDKDADKEEDEGDAGGDPAVQHVGRGLVQKSLVLSLKLGGVDGNGRKGRRFGFGSIHGCWS